MNWWAIFAAGLLAGATTCAVAQGGMLVGLINRQKKAAVAAGLAPAGKAATPAEDLIPVTGFLLGKLLVLTTVGLLLGALGAAISLDARIGGLAALVAGVMMVVMGLSTLGVPGFRDIVIPPPASWSQVVRRSTRSQSAFAPFLLGLATVLIPCGVTISMMLLAASSGSAVKGAAVMAVFVLGTAPMFAAYGFITQRYVNPDSRGLSIALGAVVVALGLVTLNGSLVALGAPVTAQTIASGLRGAKPTVVAAPVAGPAVAGPKAGSSSTKEQVLRIEASSGGYAPEAIGAKADVPTKLIIHTQDTRSCILYTVLPSLGLQTNLPVSGDTELDLGKLPAGEYPISCSMGMYSATIVVT